MSVSIEAYRDAGDVRCDDVIEPLLGDSTAAALHRAKNELDATAVRKQTTTLELITHRLDIQLGNLVTALDPSQGAAWVGKVIGIKHAFGFNTISTSLTVERTVYAR